MDPLRVRAFQSSAAEYPAAANEQGLRAMGKVTKVIHSVKDPDLLDDASDNARIRMRGFDIRPLDRSSSSLRDADKIIEKMKKAKKPAEFVLSYDGRMVAYAVRVGSDAWPLFSFDMTGETDLALRRKWMVKLMKETQIVTAADVAAFDKANPTPADPQEVAELEQQIGVTESIIDSEQDIKTWYARKYADFDWQQRRLDFLPWAKKQGFEAYAQFMVGVTDGFQDFAMMKSHVLKGCPLPVKLKAETRASMEKSFAENQAVDYADAKAEVLAIVDGSLMPKFRALRFKEADKTVAARKKTLVLQKAALAKLKARK